MGIFGSIKKGAAIAASSLPVVMILFVFSFVFNLINLMLTPENPDPNTPPPVALIAAGIAFVLVTVYMQAGSMTYMRNKIKQSAAALSDFFAGGMRYYLKMLGLSLIMAVIIGIFVLIAALSISQLGQTQRIVAGAIVSVCFIVGMFLLVLLFFAPYIAICEDAGVIASLKKSKSLVLANFMKVVGLAIVLILVGFLVGILIGFVVGLVARTMPPMGSKVLFAFLSSLVNSYLGLFVTASFMSFYLSRSSAPSN